MAFEYELTILRDFGKYVKGAVVWIEDEVKAILASEHAHSVVKVPAGTHSSVVADEPAPTAETAPVAPATDEHQA